MVKPESHLSCEEAEIYEESLGLASKRGPQQFEKLLERIHLEMALSDKDKWMLALMSAALGAEILRLLGDET